MAKLDPALLAKLPREYLEENIGERLIIVAVVFIVLQTVFVSLYYSSRYVNKTLNGWECWLFMPIGYLFTTVLCVCGILIVKIGGAGRHVEAVLIEDPTGGIVMTRSKIDKAVELIYLPSITCSKFVILCLYMRIFNTGRRYQLATYFIGSIVLLNWLAAFILSFSICRPLAAHWDHSIPGGKCGNIISAYQFISVPNIASDLMILMLPIPALYKLHVDLGTKIGLFATFLTGSVGIVTSILRLITFMHASELFKDPTYKCIPTFTYTIAEAGTYLMAACMPTLRPLKRHIFGDRSFSKTIASHINKRSGGSRGVSSFKIRSLKPEVQLDSIHMTTSNESDARTGSTLHLNNAGFLELDDQNVSVKSRTTSHEDVQVNYV